MLKKISLSAMAFTYLFAGIAHFLKRDYFIAMAPPFIPSPAAFVFLTGSLYILFGLLLAFAKTQRGACYGILLVLAMAIPVNIFMLFSETARGPIPRELILERIPFKILLMLWAWWNSRTPARPGSGPPKTTAESGL